MDDMQDADFEVRQVREAVTNLRRMLKEKDAAIARLTKRLEKYEPPKQPDFPDPESLARVLLR